MEEMSGGFRNEKNKKIMKPTYIGQLKNGLEITWTKGV